MKKFHAITASVVGAVAIAASIAGIAQGAAPPGAPPPGGGLVILDFKPAFDDQMTLLLQPRHIKLFYAGQQRNWPLAAFQLSELYNAVRRIGQSIPNYRTYNVDDAVAAIFTPKVMAMDKAIKSQDPAQFTRAYRELTQSCNDCHVAMDHGFLVMKVPDAAAASNFVDQDFAPPRN